MICLNHSDAANVQSKTVAPVTEGLEPNQSSYNYNYNQKLAIVTKHMLKLCCEYVKWEVLAVNRFSYPSNCFIVHPEEVID